MDGRGYVESLGRMKTIVYIDGETVVDYWDHPALRPAVNALAATYDLAARPDLDKEIHDLILSDSHLTGGKINRFLHIVLSREDLLARMRLQRAMMRYTGGCFGGRCVAGAVINALWSVTYEVDRASGGRVAGSAALASPTPSGVYLPDSLTVNAAKLFMNEAILKAGQRLADVGGGILVTRPSSRDLKIPKVGELLAKYHQGREGVDVEDRLKMARLAETLSGLSAPTTILSVIAAGPPATQRLNFRLLTDFAGKRRAAERLAGITKKAP